MLIDYYHVLNVYFLYTLLIHWKLQMFFCKFSNLIHICSKGLKMVIYIILFNVVRNIVERLQTPKTVLQCLNSGFNTRFKIYKIFI